MMLPWGEFKPAVGAQIGFAVAINNDADNAAGRENQVFPEDGLSAAWQSTDNCVTLTRTANEYIPPVVDEPADEAPAEEGAAVVAPAPTSPKTADAGIVGAAAVMVIAAGVVLSKKH